jgi:hypothetical protein
MLWVGGHRAVQLRHNHWASACLLRFLKYSSITGTYSTWAMLLTDPNDRTSLLKKRNSGSHSRTADGSNFRHVTTFCSVSSLRHFEWPWCFCRQRQASKVLVLKKVSSRLPPSEGYTCVYGLASPQAFSEIIRHNRHYLIHVVMSDWQISYIASALRLMLELCSHNY